MAILASEIVDLTDADEDLGDEPQVIATREASRSIRNLRPNEDIEELFSGPAVRRHPAVARGAVRPTAPTQLPSMPWIGVEGGPEVYAARSQSRRSRTADLLRPGALRRVPLDQEGVRRPRRNRGSRTRRGGARGLDIPGYPTIYHGSHISDTTDNDYYQHQDSEDEDYEYSSDSDFGVHGRFGYFNTRYAQPRGYDAHERAMARHISQAELFESTLLDRVRLRSFYDTVEKEPLQVEQLVNKTQVPLDTPEGLTRTAKPDQTIVCVDCHNELGVVSSSPDGTERAGSRKIYMRNCGHTFCGACVSAISSAKKKRAPPCPVPHCRNRRLGVKTTFLQVYN